MPPKNNTLKESKATQQQILTSDATTSTPKPQNTPNSKNNMRTASKDNKNFSDKAANGSRTMPAQGPADGILPPCSAKDPNTNKRPRDDDDESLDGVSKRPKINSTAGLVHRTTELEGAPSQQPSADTTSIQESTNGSTTATQASATPAITAGKNAAARPIIPVLTSTIPAEVQHLQNKYEFTTMSIPSSAKMVQKVMALLYRVGKFSFVDIDQKPGIVVLHAHANAANKMVSIVEIAKEELQKKKVKWYQYSKLHGEIKPLKAKQPKKIGEGKTIAEWNKEKPDTQATMKTGEETMDAAELARKKNAGLVDDDDMEVAFETMQPPKKADLGLPLVKKGNKVRAVPVMTIYFSRVPVPGLKELYG